MFLNAPARLAKTLPQLADNRERRAKITQRDISQIIGLSREMTNEQLRGWERGNWVRLERGGVVLLQPKLLANFAEKPAMPFGHGFAPDSPR
jgi:CRP-like cAMP-binding protein